MVSEGSEAPPLSHYSGSLSPSIVFVGETWGESEEETKRPFSGSSGRELFLMLGEALPDREPELWAQARKMFFAGHGWIGKRDEWARSAGFGFTNTINLRPADGKIDSLCVSKKELPNGYSLPQIDQGRYIAPEHLHHLDRLRDELSSLRPNLIVALGNVACWALLGTRGISGLRGTVARDGLTGLGLKVLPTFHPSNVLKQWSWRQIVVGDLMKAGREGEFGEIRRPARSVLINPTIEEVEKWTERTLSAQVPLSCDTETAKGQITMVGFADSRSSAIVVPFRNFLGAKEKLHYWNPNEEIRAWGCVKRLLEGRNYKIFQNGLYDIQYFLAHGLETWNAREDTMLLHHSILPEMQKGLGFLGSVYSNEPAWKIMRKKRADEPEKADE